MPDIFDKIHSTAKAPQKPKAGGDVFDRFQQNAIEDAVPPQLRAIFRNQYYTRLALEAVQPQIDQIVANVKAGRSALERDPRLPPLWYIPDQPAEPQSLPEPTPSLVTRFAQVAESIAKSKDLSEAKRDALLAKYRARYLKEAVEEARRPLHEYHAYLAARKASEEKKGRRGEEALDAFLRDVARNASGVTTVAGKLTGKDGLTDLGRAFHLAAEDFELAPQLDSDWLDWVINVSAGNVATTGIGTALSAVPGVGPALAFGHMFAIEGSEAYHNALDNGVPEDQAAAIGMGVGLANAVIEMALGAGGKYTAALRKKVTGKTLANWGKRRVRDSVVEALEELFQEQTQLGAETLYRDVDWKEWVERSAQAMAGGALLGGGLSATVGTVSELFADEKLKRKQEEEKAVVNEAAKHALGLRTALAKVADESGMTQVVMDATGLEERRARTVARSAIDRLIRDAEAEKWDDATINKKAFEYLEAAYKEFAPLAGQKAAEERIAAGDGGIRLATVPSTQSLDPEVAPKAAQTEAQFVPEEETPETPAEVTPEAENPITMDELKALRSLGYSVADVGKGMTPEQAREIIAKGIRKTGEVAKDIFDRFAQQGTTLQQAAKRRAEQQNVLASAKAAGVTAPSISPTTADEQARHPLFQSPQIEKAAKTASGEAVYNAVLEETGSGPLDGGRYAVAKALQNVLGGELVTVTGTNRYSGSGETAHHIALKVGDTYIDANGKQTEAEFLATWREEGVDNITIRPYQEGDVADSPRSPKLVEKLTSILGGKTLFQTTPATTPQAAAKPNITPESLVTGKIKTIDDFKAAISKLNIKGITKEHIEAAAALIEGHAKAVGEAVDAWISENIAGVTSEAQDVRGTETLQQLTKTVYDYAKKAGYITEKAQKVWDALQAWTGIDRYMNAGRSTDKNAGPIRRLKEGRRFYNITGINEALRANPEAVAKIRAAEEATGFKVLGDNDQLLRSHTHPIEQRTEIKSPDSKIGQNEYQTFQTFIRSFAQTFLDKFDPEAIEHFRSQIVKAVEAAYKDAQAGSQQAQKLFGKTAQRVKAREFTVAPPLRDADKTLAAINLSTICPMFHIGASGCYLDGCYVTGMGRTTSVVNFYRSALYTGEILQLSQDSINRLNAIGGLRVNGMGDLSMDQMNQVRDIFRHAAMRGLELKVITKQEATLQIVAELQKSDDPLVRKTAKNVVVQTTVDTYWVPVDLDDIPGSMVNLERLMGTTDEQLAEKLKAAGRDAKFINGRLYRKYGFSSQQMQEFAKKYPTVKIQPRAVVGTKKEIAEYALHNPEILQTWMHATIPPGLYSEVEGRVLTEGEVGNYKSRIGIVKIGGEWMILAQGEKGTSNLKQRQLYTDTERYIKENYTPKQADKIFNVLTGQLGKTPSALCCSASAAADACVTCTSHCADRTAYQGRKLYDVAKKGQKYSLYQDANGAVTFLENGQALLQLFENANASTLPHELFHIWVAELQRMASDPGAPGWVAEALETLEDWLGIENGVWTREHHEHAARGFEKWLREGKTTNNKLAEVFRRFREWLRAIYKKLNGSEIDVYVSPEAKAVFDRLVGGTGQVFKVKPTHVVSPAFGGKIDIIQHVRNILQDRNKYGYVNAAPTDIREAVLRAFGKTNLDMQLADNAYQRRQALHDDETWEAITIYLQYRHRPKLLEQYRAKIRDEKLLKIIDRSQNLTTAEKASADKLAAEYRQDLLLAKAAGIEIGVVDDYVNQIWRFEGKHVADKPFGIKLDEAKRRKLMDGYLEGIVDHGLTPLTLNASKLRRIYQEHMAKAINAKVFLDTISQLTAPDGSPLLVADTTANRKNRDYVAVRSGAVNFYRWMGTEKRTKTHPRTGAKYVVEKTFLRHTGALVHKEAAPNVKALLETSLVKQLPFLRTLLRLNAAGKAMLLSFSGFHHMALANNAIFYGVNPFWFGPTNHKAGLTLLLNEDPIVMRGIRNGLTVKDSASINFSTVVANEGIEEVGKVLKKLGLGKVTRGVLGVKQWLDKGLWDRYYVGLKMMGFKLHYLKLRSLYPHKTADEVAQIAARDLNDGFGGLAWELMGVTKTAYDAMRLGLLAPDWTIGNWRTFLGGIGFSNLANAIRERVTGRESEQWAFGKNAKGARRYFARIIFTLALLTLAGNLALWGTPFPHPPEDRKKYWWCIMLPFTDKDGKHYYLDLFRHFIEPIRAVFDPWRFASGKMAVLPKQIMDQLEGKNWRGDWIGTNKDLLTEGKLYRSKYDEWPEPGFMGLNQALPRVLHAVSSVAPIPFKDAFLVATGDKELIELSSSAGLAVTRGRGGAPDDTNARKQLFKSPYSSKTGKKSPFKSPYK